MTKRRQRRAPANPDETSDYLPGDLSPSQRRARMVRVNHAGEFGAQRIYAGQLAVLGCKPVAKTLRHMAAQEEAHLEFFRCELLARQVRPTVLHPLWRAAGFALGAGTALLGEKAAMACTVAVEEVIDAHYARQLTELRQPDDAPLRTAIRRFRDEEIEHRALGLQHGALETPGYPILSAAIRAASRAAIWLSERF